MTWDDDSGAPKKPVVTAAPMAPTADLSPGTILSDTYEVEEHIALGGMAEVYRARNIHTDEPVAIKVILPEFARDEMRTALFLKEATVLSRLHHEAIVHYHMFTVEKETGRPYMVMEFVKGTPLSDRMKEGPLDAQSVKALIQRVAAGLSVAHELGVVHRDLSPDNVVLPDGKVAKAKIIDFGIAKAIMAGGGTLLGGKFAGKYNFVSPEQLGLFGGEISGQSDIYSLGLIAVAALRGEALDMSGSHAEVIEKRRQVPELSGVDESIRPTIAAMLAPNPADRPASMQAVIEMLNAPPRAKAAPAAADPWSDPQPKRDATVIAPRPAPPRPPAGGAGGLRRPPSSATVVTGAPVSAPPPRQAESDSPFGAYVPPPGGASPLAAGPATGAAQPRAAQTPPPLPPYKPKRGGGGGLIALIVVVILLAGGGLFAFSQNWFGLLGPKAGITDTTQSASTTNDTTGKVDTPSVDTTTTTTTAGTDASTGTEPDTGKSTLVPDDAAQQQAQQTTQPPVTETTTTDQTASNEGTSTGTDSTTQSSETTPTTTTTTTATTSTTTSDDTKVAIAEPKVDVTTIPPVGDVPARLAWVNAYELSSCEFAQALAADDRSMSIEGFGMTPPTFETMMNRFTADNGFEPDVLVRVVTEPECPAVDFLRFVKAITVAGPLLNVSTAPVPSGTTLSGNLQAISGWQNDLLLVDDAGIVHNVALTPAPSGSTASFSAKLENGAAAPQPQLLLAISTRNGLVAPGSAEGVPATAVFPAILREIRQKNPEISVAVKFLKVTPR